MDEPVQVNNNPDGTCITAGCIRPATFRLTLRGRPIDSFPNGLLTKSDYCLDDAFWFLGIHIAKYGSQFVSLEEIE